MHEGGVFNHMNIGELIKNIRSKQGITQESLAEDAQLSRNTIVNFETGKRIPRVDDLVKIAKALGVEVSIFFQENPTLFAGVEKTTQDSN